MSSTLVKAGPSSENYQNGGHEISSDSSSDVEILPMDQYNALLEEVILA